MQQVQIKSFQKFILSWYAKNRRDLPWRNTRDPYKILVSEIMSQQTQISRVVPKYNLWLKRFPTVQDLATAKVSQVLIAWSGLGYNRRGLYLQKCAQEIITKYNGKFPQTEKDLLRLPGIGEYTARAILCFAFNRQIVVIDTNIKKVIAVHFYNGKVPEKNALETFAHKLLPKGRAYAWNQALMDYAARELKKEKIAIPKQSAFKNSRRYYRGQIIKYLVTNSKATRKDFSQLFKETISNESIEKILQGLISDKLIIQDKKNNFCLP